MQQRGCTSIPCNSNKSWTTPRRIYSSIGYARRTNATTMINGGIHPAKTPSRNNSILPIASPLWSLPINDGHSCLLCAWPLTSDNLETATKLRPQSSKAGTRYHFRKKFLASTLKKRDPTLGKRNAGAFAKQPNSRRVLVFGLIHLHPSFCYRNSPFAWLLLQATQGFILVTEP